MAIHDIAFRFNAASHSYASRVLKDAVMRPMFGAMRTDRETHAAFNKVLSKWRSQLTALHEEGWQISKSKMLLARNCPPPGSGGTAALQPCGLRICPFCYARQLLVIRHNVAKAHAAIPDARLITYTLMVDDASKPSQQLHVDATDSCWDSLASVLSTHKLVRNRIRERVFPQAYGTACIVHLILRPFKKRVSNHIGYAATHHKCIGLVPQAAELNIPANGKLFERGRVSQHMLCWLIAKAFKYPADWLRLDPKLMIEFISVAHKQRFMIRTGVLRDKLCTRTYPTQQFR